MAGPKPVRPLSTKGSLEKSSDDKKEKKKNSKKPTNTNVNQKPAKTITESSKIVVKDSVVVKLQPTQVEEAVKAFTKLLDLNSAKAAEKSLFSSEGAKISLQISGIKLPRDVENQVVKIRLPHSPLPGSKDVCLFVKDLEKGLKVDHEATVQHFNNLLADKGVTGITKVISLRELKVEYKQYEAKTQLCHMFDQFLADDRIIRLLPPFLGKPFYKRKKLPMQVNLSAKDLPAEFAKCLNTTQLPLKNMGSCSTVVVGISTLTSEQLIENTKAVVEKLEQKYPGGWVNIRSIHINSGSTSLPLYASFRSTAEVGLVRGGKKPSRAVVVDELSTVVGGTVVVTPFGTVKVKRKADPEWRENDETLEELVQDERRHKGEEEEEVDTENNQDEKPTGKDHADRKSKKQKKKSEDEESEDEMEDQEMEYMKKVADEEEQMEKQLEENEDNLKSKLKADDNEEDDDSEEEVDDDAEAENLLSEGESSDSDEELIMKNVADDDEEEEEEAPIKKKKSKKSEKSGKKASKSLKTSADQSALKKSTKKEKKVQKKSKNRDKK